MAVRAAEVRDDMGDVGINELLRDSYALFRQVLNGDVAPNKASAAARTACNVLKGLELRCKFGEDALRF